MRRRFIAWIYELLGLLVTASGMVLVVDLLGWWTVPVTISTFYVIRLAGPRRSARQVREQRLSHMDR